MLALPQLPTDNLYKFIAISGLVVFIASGLLIAARERLLSDIVHEQGRRTNILAAERPKATTEQQRADIARLEAELKSGYELFDDAFAVSNFYGVLAVAGEVIGLIVTFVGFRLWYTRVQVFQDRILVAQAKQVTSSSVDDTQKA